ncbi:TPA: DUF1372 family protein [Streptococcus suis]|nr:DUF1372 family protein [Streptococcus suis]
MKKSNTIPVIVAFFKMVIAIAVCIHVFNRNERIRELESREPIIIYQVDNAGTEMIGKVTDKDVVDGRYYVEVSPYGKFLVTEEQYNEIEIGQDMPEYLKGRK